MSHLRVRHVADVNPPCPAWDLLPDDAELTFVPLEAVWPRRIDVSRSRTKAETASGYTRFQQGDVVVPKITPTFEGDRSTWVERIPTFVATGTTELHVVRARPGVEPRYLDYLFSSAPFLRGGEAEMIGVAGQKRVPDSWLRDFPVPIVEQTEQRAIAEYLDAVTTRIDALIAKKQQLIHLLEERWVASRSTSILRGVDPVSGHGELPEGWSCPQLGVIIELQRGHDLPAEARREGRFPVISSGGVSGYHDERACLGPAVVTGRYGTVGEVYFVEEDCWPLNTTLYVKDFRGNDPRWVAFLLESLPLDAESEKSAVGGINRNVIGKLRVPHPPFEDQRRIASELARAKARQIATRRVLDRHLELLAEHRQALITAAVTGEFAVSGAA